MLFLANTCQQCSLLWAIILHNNYQQGVFNEVLVGQYNKVHYAIMMLSLQELLMSVAFKGAQACMGAALVCTSVRKLIETSKNHHCISNLASQL